MTVPLPSEKRQVPPMGYPMTFQRFVNRNALMDGDYGKAALWTNGVNADEKLDDVPAVSRARRQALASYEQRIATVMGDLRRLERDTLDEEYICKQIASRTGVEPDVVAGVLKEWLAL